MIQMQQTPRADCNPRSIRSKVEKTPKAAIVFHVHISVTYQELLRQATSYDADIQCEALMHKYQHRLRKGSCSFILRRSRKLCGPMEGQRTTPQGALRLTA